MGSSKKKLQQILVLFSIKWRRASIGNKAIIFFALSILMLFHYRQDLQTMGTEEKWAAVWACGIIVFCRDWICIFLNAFLIYFPLYFNNWVIEFWTYGSLCVDLRFSQSISRKKSCISLSGLQRFFCSDKTDFVHKSVSY